MINPLGEAVRGQALMAEFPGRSGIMTVPKRIVFPRGNTDERGALERRSCMS